MAGYNSNVKQRSTQMIRVHNNKRVTPTRYYSEHNKGTMCGSVDGELVRDSAGAVVPWSRIPYGRVE